MANEYAIIPTFHFEGPDWTDELKYWARELYVTLRGPAAEATDKVIDMANEDFHRRYPGHEITEDDAIYNEFMASYLNEYLVMYNNLIGAIEAPPGLRDSAFPFEVWCDKKMCTICLYLRGKKESYMYMTIKFADPEVEKRFSK